MQFQTAFLLTALSSICLLCGGPSAIAQAPAAADTPAPGEAPRAPEAPTTPEPGDVAAVDAEPAAPADAAPPVAPPAPAPTRRSPQAGAPPTAPAPQLSGAECECGCPASAAEESAGWQQRNLVDAATVRDSGGYGGFVMRRSEMFGQNALFIGGRGGWLIDHHLVLGGAGFAQVMKVEHPTGERDDTTLEFGYGGVFVGYHLMPRRVVHAVVGTIVGWGGVGHSVRDPAASPEFEGDAVFVVEPSLDLELNVFSMMRVQLGVSYRIVRSVDLPGADSRDLSGFAIGGGVMFGKF